MMQRLTAVLLLLAGLFVLGCGNLNSPCQSGEREVVDPDTREVIGCVEEGEDSL